MVTTVIRHRLAVGVRRLTRCLHPRQSITGKLVLTALAMIGVTTVIGLVTIWQVTTTVVATTEQAEMVYQGGIIAIIILAVTQVIAVGIVHRFVVGGLRTLQKQTREVIEKGTHETTFSSGRSDEIGQVTWNVAEMQAQLAEQVAVIESLNRELTTVATAQSQTLAACSQGDLTRRMDAETGTPQFDTIAMRFNEMMDRTEAMVAEVRSFSRFVTDAADDAADQAETATGAIATITDSTESISADVTRQRNRVESTANAIDELATSIDDIAREAARVSDRSKRAARETNAGSIAAGSALEELSDIRAQTDESVREIEALSESVADVEDIIELISTLTDQTNQLAVNAQIEAARTGGGERSNRLTDRIKRLAANTDEAASEIEAILESIEKQTEVTLEEIEATQGAVERGTKTIETALGALENVSDVVEATEDGVTTIESATQTQARRVDDVVDAAEGLRAIGERTAMEAADVADTTNEQQATIQTIAARLERFSRVSNALDTHLDVFTVRPTAASATSQELTQ